MPGGESGKRHCLTGDLLEEEEGEWVVAMRAAIALPLPRLAGAGGRPPGRRGAPNPNYPGCCA